MVGKAESSEVTSVRNDLQNEIDRATDAESQLKEDLGDIITETKNIFNPKGLLNASGWTKDRDSYTGTAGNLGLAYKENNYPISFEPNTKYTLSLKAKNDGAVTTDGYGI